MSISANLRQILEDDQRKYDALCLRGAMPEHFVRSHYDERITDWLKGSEAGDPNGLFLVALCLLYLIEPSQAVREVMTNGTDAERARAKVKMLNQRTDENAITDLKKASELGHLTAQYHLASCCLTGLGIEEDHEQSFYWYTRLADAKDAGSSSSRIQFAKALGMHGLGLLYSLGKGVKMDWETSFRLQQEAAEAGCLLAEVELGEHYRLGLGVEPDYEKALACFRKAQEAEVVNAYTGLGRLYANGEGVEKDPMQSAENLVQAAMLGNPIAPYFYGVLIQHKEEDAYDYQNAFHALETLALRGHLPNIAAVDLSNGLDAQKVIALLENAIYEGNVEATKLLIQYQDYISTEDYSFATGFDLLKEAAQDGDRNAQFSLAHCYHQGDMVPRDEAMAIRWLQAAAEQNHAQAQFHLGCFYEKGYGDLKSDMVTANRYFLLAAKQEFPPAQNSYAFSLQHGLGIEQNKEEALYWFRKAAENDDEAGQFNLSYCYFHGEGVEEDAEIALQWLKKAAQKDYPPAQYRLGMMYLNGDGVFTDGKAAIHWLRKAAASGHDEAEDVLAEAEDLEALDELSEMADPENFRNFWENDKF